MNKTRMKKLTVKFERALFAARESENPTERWENSIEAQRIAKRAHNKKWWDRATLVKCLNVHGNPKRVAKKREESMKRKAKSMAAKKRLDKKMGTQTATKETRTARGGKARNRKKIEAGIDRIIGRSRTNGSGRDPRLPKAGSTVTAKYKKKFYRATVGADDFTYKGKKFGSLTAIGRVITNGTNVNGFRFFGLTDR